MYDDVESFLEELDTRMNAYRSARINFIKLSQRKAGEPSPTVTTWQKFLERITVTQDAVMELILSYGKVDVPGYEQTRQPT